MAKPTGPVTSIQYRQKQPLEDDILATGPLRQKSKKRKTRRADEEDEHFVDSKASRKILKIGRDLQEEEQELSKPQAPNAAFTVESRNADEGAPQDDEDVAEAWEDEEGEDVEGNEVDPDDLYMFNKFVPPGEEPTLDLSTSKDIDESQGTNLANLILEQIAAHEAGLDRQAGLDGDDLGDEAIPPKVVEVYSKVGMMLSRYKSGKLPKPFKILPTLPRWEELLAITRPDGWTTNACFEATRIFVSPNQHIAQRFIEMALLQRAREDIHETRKLNVHLYNALRKATFRPAAFFKGFLFPLVESGTCTLREAQIIASAITRVSIPALHSAAALMRLTDIAAEQASMATESGGATNIFIRAFLEKKYALPYKVVDNLVFHFLRYRGAQPSGADAMEKDGRPGTAQDAKLPVLWHQSLLAFAQRYRNDITEDQREALLDLVQVKGHKDIGPEVRRELLQGRGRGVTVPDAAPTDGDDTMAIDPA